MSYTSSNPSWWATISSYSKKASGGPNIINLGKGRGPNDIVSFSISKSITGAGTLNLVLVPGKYNYFDLILPNSAVEFWVDGGDGKGPCMFVGYVNRVSLTRSAGGGGVEDQRILLACSDATRVLQDLKVFFSGYTKPFTTVFKHLGVIKAIKQGNRGTFSKGNKKIPSTFFLTPPEFTFYFLSGWMESPKKVTSKASLPNISLMLPTTSKNPVNFVETMDWSTFVYAPQYFWPFARFVKMQEGGNFSSLWELMNRYSHALFNELFIDTRPQREISGKPTTPQDSRGEEGNAFKLSLRNHIDGPDSSLIKSVAQKIAQVNNFDVLSFRPYFGPEQSQWAQRLVFRPRPYLSDDLRRLYRYKVNSSEVSNFDLGFSVSNAYNYFRIKPSFANAKLDALPFAKKLIGVMNFDSVTRLGLKRYEPPSDFVLPVSFTKGSSTNKNLIGAKLSENSDFLKISAYQTHLLALMHYQNDRYLNGSLTFPSVRPDIRVGNALEFNPGNHTSGRLGDVNYSMSPTLGEEDNVIFYIETVTHSATADADSTTSVGLVRGRPLWSDEDALESVTSLLLVGAGGVLKDPGLSNLQFIKLGQNISKK